MQARPSFKVWVPTAWKTYNSTYNLYFTYDYTTCLYKTKCGYGDLKQVYTTGASKVKSVKVKIIWVKFVSEKLPKSFDCWKWLIQVKLLYVLGNLLK